MNNKLSGIIPPLLTPLKSRDELDKAGLERLLNHTISGGIHGSFILGTTGEAPGLSYRLRREMITETCRLVDNRIPVLVGVTDTSFNETVDLANFAAENGASAVVVAQPYYFLAGQPELLEYLEHLAPKINLPIMLYNMPSLTKLYYEPKTVERAMQQENIVGLKDSSGNMDYFHKLLQLRKKREDFSLFMGPEQLLGESVLFGADGGVCGGANIAPELYVGMWLAAKSEDMPKVRQLQDKVMLLCETLYCLGQHSSSYLKGLKAAASILGLCDNFLAEPFHGFRKEEFTVVAEKIEQLKTAEVL